MAVPCPRAMVKDDRHGALSHGEGRRAEEQERHEPDDPDGVAVGEEALHLADDTAGCRGSPAQIPPHRLEQLPLVDEMGQADQQPMKRGTIDRRV